MADTPIEVKKIPRVYMTDTNLARKSGHHTVYVGTPGTAGELHKLEFEFGIAKNVPLNVYERFRDAGHATTDIPKRSGQD